MSEKGSQACIEIYTEPASNGGKCLICLLNGLAVGFKKVPLTFGGVDQEETPCYIMRVSTEEGLIVYLYICDHQKIAVELLPGRARLPHVKLG